MLAGIDLVTGKVHALVTDRHRSREIIYFFSNRFNAAYPTQIRDIRLNPRGSFRRHLQEDTNAWLAIRGAGRFEFTFMLKHGSWLNFIEETFFSKPLRSVLRRISVSLIKTKN